VNRWYFITGNKSSILGQYSSHGYPGSRSGSSITLLLNESIILFGGEIFNYGNSYTGDINDMWIFFFSNCLPKYGPICNETCFCVHGICNPFNGSCTCNSNYYGPTCNNSCSCVNGVCNSNNGSCTCNDSYIGVFCNEKCIDPNCVIVCTCYSKTCTEENIICNNSINIVSNSIYLENYSQLNIQGNITIDGSNLNLTSLQLTSNSFIIISNSNIMFNSTTFYSKECINISNTNFTIDLSQNESTNSLLLLQSAGGCLNVTSYSIKFLNQPNCKTLKIEKNSSSLVIIFNEQTNCGAENQFQLNTLEIVLIIIGSIVVLVIIFIILALTIPSLKDIIFPFRSNKLKSVNN